MQNITWKMHFYRCYKPSYQSNCFGNDDGKGCFLGGPTTQKHNWFWQNVFKSSSELTEFKKPERVLKKGANQELTWKLQHEQNKMRKSTFLPPHGLIRFVPTLLVKVIFAVFLKSMFLRFARKNPWNLNRSFYGEKHCCDQNLTQLASLTTSRLAESRRKMWKNKQAA